MNQFDLAVSIHPYIHSPLSRGAIFLNRLLALSPIALLAFYHYGLMALATILAAAFFMLLPAYAALKARGRRLADVEYENYYYAILFALALPSGASYYIVISGALLLNALLFFPRGSDALRIINPVAATFSVLALAFNEKMLFFNGPRAFMSGSWFAPFASGGSSPGFLFNLHHGEFSGVRESARGVAGLLSGWHPGHYGELSITLIAAAFIFLIFKKCVDPVPFTGAWAGLCLALAFLYYGRGFGAFCAEILGHAFGSMFLFYSCFVLTDYYSSPQRYTARLVFGAFFGALFALLSYYNDGRDCSAFSLAIASCFVPMLDELFSAGGRRE